MTERERHKQDTVWPPYRVGQRVCRVSRRHREEPFVQVGVVESVARKTATVRFADGGTEELPSAMLSSSVPGAIRNDLRMIAHCSANGDDPLPPLVMAMRVCEVMRMFRRWRKSRNRGKTT